MDKLEQYRQFVKQILTEHAQISPTTDSVKAELIFDSDRDHYQLAYVGWQGDKRVL
jgi:XisI protein